MAMTLFEQIANHEIPAKIVHEDEEIVAFYDISPQAPAHVVIIPRRAIPSVNDITTMDAELIGKLVLVAKEVAKELGVAESGYRLVFNCGPDGGQTVDHLHLHLLGGRAMRWPPG
ncbi:MAG: histidine triad nucleotide-binding protein [Bacteroidota bacterium]|nr:histidine triad nucleotide-binding protein [Bacteroidota bacterium]MDP4244074.1 histidine triad nucleotide-binding protein [Bacteroidota bacterium]MDP4289228.1 histidine triad nucleotide-binding protein [Bacteroidota bacterium]